MAPKKSILIAMYGATAGKVAITNIEAAINQAVLVTIPHQVITYNFLFHFLEKEIGRTLKLVQGGQPNLNASIIKNIDVPLPTLPVQQKITKILTTADNEIELLQKKLAYLKQEKKALMQQLLTGKRRVKLCDS